MHDRQDRPDTRAQPAQIGQKHLSRSEDEKSEPPSRTRGRAANENPKDPHREIASVPDTLFELLSNPYQ
jgi:hypothetical protein